MGFFLTGFGVERRTSSGEKSPARAWREGEWVVLDTGLSPGNYGVYAGVGLFDPFAPGYLRPGNPSGGPWTLLAPPGSPPLVDLLAENPLDQTRAYESGVLKPSRPKRLLLRRESSWPSPWEGFPWSSPFS